MNIGDALTCLGTKRIIWIDDEFNEEPIELAKMMVKHIAIAKTLTIPEERIREIVENFDTFEATAEDDLAEVLENDQEAADRLQVELLAEIAKQGGSKKELSDRAIQRVCEVLNVKDEDRWTFAGVENKLSDLCKDKSDETILYIVDLNDAATRNADRGLEVLVHLEGLNSRGTAFLLTHEANIADESVKEHDLRTKLKNLSGSDLNIPTCVIAKERIITPANKNNVEEALRTAVKRAGLRRSVHEVLWKAQTCLKDSFVTAAERLTSITPEKLESFVVDKGYREGVSELHVVERALTAHMARDIRHLFGTDEALIGSAERMRRMYGIKLRSFDMTPEENLEKFRRAEIWEEPELINTSLSPISPGDVFEVFLSDKPTASSGVKFLLLGQACDIALRSDGKRDQDSALLVPLRERKLGARNEGTLKKPLLLFVLDQIQYMCDFRGASPVRMGILDLASFRKDGEVRVDEGHGADRNLLTGQTAAYDQRTKAATQLLIKQVNVAGSITDGDPRLQLTFDTDAPYKQICRGVLQKAVKAGKGGKPSALPKRISWKLRRCGRIRMPYAAAIFENYNNVMSRRAFEMDYMDLHLERLADQHFAGSGI